MKNAEPAMLLSQVTAVQGIATDSHHRSTYGIRARKRKLLMAIGLRLTRMNGAVNIDRKRKRPVHEGDIMVLQYVTDDSIWRGHWVEHPLWTLPQGSIIHAKWSGGNKGKYILRQNRWGYNFADSLQYIENDGGFVEYLDGVSCESWWLVEPYQDIMA